MSYLISWFLWLFLCWFISWFLWFFFSWFILICSFVTLFFGWLTIRCLSVRFSVKISLSFWVYCSVVDFSDFFQLIYSVDFYDCFAVNLSVFFFWLFFSWFIFICSYITIFLGSLIKINKQKKIRKKKTDKSTQK